MKDVSVQSDIFEEMKFGVCFLFENDLIKKTPKITMERNTQSWCLIPSLGQVTEIVKI